MHWLLLGVMVAFAGMLILAWCGTFDWREVKILLCVLGGFALAVLAWPVVAVVLVIILIMRLLGLWRPRRR